MARRHPDPIHVSYLQRAAGLGYGIERLFDSVRSRLPDTIDAHVHQAPYAGTHPFRILRNCVWARGRQGEVNHITGDAYYLAVGLCSRRTVLTIHDCVALNRLTGWRKLVIRWLWYRLPTWRARMVTVISEEARRELLSYVRIPEERVRTIPNCIGDEFQASPKAAWPERPVLLHIGTTPNKNLANLGRALKGMPVEVRIIGRPTEKDHAVLAECGISYTFAAGLSDEQIVQEYEASDAVVFASTYEGFGLPIVEAQAVGRPVVTSALPPMSTVAGQGACLVNPHDPLSIREGVTRILASKPYRDELIQSGYANAQKYRVQRIVDQYVAIYEEIATRRA